MAGFKDRCATPRWSTGNLGGAMRHEGVTVFLLFFGLALLDAIADGQWLRAGFWVAVGVGFVLLDRRSDRGRPVRRSGVHPFWV
jgi:hypothetical protein